MLHDIVQAHSIARCGPFHALLRRLCVPMLLGVTAAQEQGLNTRFAFGHVAVVGKPWFAVGKDAPAIDLPRWQASLARLEANGTAARIRKRYLGE